MAFEDPPIRGKKFAAALETIRSHCEQRLGHLGTVFVRQHDLCAATGVGLMLHERTGKFRHAVTGESSRAKSNPIEFADEASDRLLAWHTWRRPEDKGPGGLEGEEEFI